ncbi:MAG: twin-arginine translocase TatA/TatE family subunit [Chloroflexi bacterium]|nr:twin-arginine translocase TatA/TatE family subunit [Chloroflexota bacterium]MBV9893071.1 twin-arginine translocase TatA/TatE family subunit [Chloroflexota bacterium]
MNILGMGPLEILLIVVLALIVFGPAKLPEIMGQVGKAIADFRRATSELSDEFNRTIQAELAETRSVVEDTKSAVTGVHTSINAAITGTTPAPMLTTPAPAPTATVTASTNGASTNGATAVVEDETPPMANTAHWSWETAAPAPAAPAVEVHAPETPAVAPTREVVRAAQEAAPPPARSRRTSGRDDLLPPY